MDLQLVALVAGAAFTAGVVFGKYVISEAAAIKAHVTAEVDKLRADLSSSLSNAAKKV